MITGRNSRFKGTECVLRKAKSCTLKHSLILASSSAGSSRLRAKIKDYDWEFYSTLPSNIHKKATLQQITWGTCASPCTPTHTNMGFMLPWSQIQNDWKTESLHTAQYLPFPKQSKNDKSIKSRSKARTTHSFWTNFNPISKLCPCYYEWQLQFPRPSCCKSLENFDFVWNEEQQLT